MASTNPSATDRLSRRRTYRRLMFGCIAIAVLLGFGFRAVDRPVLGEAVYWLGILGFFGIWFASPLSLFDERDRALERRASLLAIQVVGAVLVLGASAGRLGVALDLFTLPTAVWGALYGYVGLFVVFGVAYAWIKYRP